MATSTARLNGLDDSELASLAKDGDGQAFAALYDRHERRVFGFCVRLLGSEDAAADATQETFMRLLVRLPALRGRELNFVAYALTTARHACYDTLSARRRVQPVAETPEPVRAGPGALELDPERAALLASTREQVRTAHARLSERQREVLALRELEQLSYEEIGEIVELNENAVAQLISRARIRLRDLVRGGELESIAASTPECARALPLLARIQDAQDGPAEELDWLRGHLAACESCRLSRAAMEEAGVSYRALGPIVPVLWLRHTTIARAAELVHADWSAQAGPAPGAPPAPPGGDAAAGRAAATSAALPAARDDGAGLLHRHRGRMLALIALITAILAAVLAAGIHPDARISSGAPVAHSAGAVTSGSATIATGRRPTGRVRARGGGPAPALTHVGTTPLLPAGVTAEAPRSGASVPRHAPRRRAPRHTPVPAGSGQPTPAPGTQTTASPAPASPSPPAPAGGSAGSPPAEAPSGTSTTGTGTGGGCTLAIACP
jgi:RNA polymerase sigma-70 factor (ECF subfamily)